MKKTITILLILAGLCINAQAQKEMSNWTMGNGCNIKFTRAGIVCGKTTPIKTLEGCASISDKITGRLLFFTDGVSVWDSTFTQMPSGFGLKGDISSTQSALIVPMPCNPNKFYIFTTYAQGGFLSSNHSGFNYSIVDMTKRGGLGDVVTKNIQLYEPSCEKLCATFASDNSSVWVVSHRFNSHDFVVYNVSSTGVSKASSISMGCLQQDPPYAPFTGLGAIGAMVFSNDGHYLAVANAYSGQLELFLFDKSGGNIINRIAVDSAFFPKDGPYGLSFSPDNTKLYATTIKGDALYQYDMKAPDTLIPRTRSAVAWDTLDVLGQLQLGPDGKIYVARQNRRSLAVINSPNKFPGNKCGFVRNGVSLGKNYSILGLPNFISNYAAPLISQKVYYKNCDKLDSLTYTTLPIHIKGKYTWNFSDSLSGKNDSSALPQPLHLFNAPGFHKISLSLTGCNYIDTFSRTVDVSPHPFTMTVHTNSLAFNNKTVSVCPGNPVIFVATGAPAGFKFQWLVNGAKVCTCDSIFLLPSHSSTALVQCGMNTPCFTGDTVFVNVYKKPVAGIVQNAGVCLNGSTKLWAKGGQTYLWTPGAYLDSTDIANPTFTGNVPTTYTVVVIDSNQCRDTATTTVNVYNTIFAEAGSDVMTDEMGKVQLHGNSNGVTIEWLPMRGLDNSHTLTPNVTTDETTQYVLIAVDSHGCKATDSVWVHVNRTPSLFVTGAFTPNNDGINDLFKVFTHNITAIHLRIFNRYGNIIYESSNMPATWDGKYNGVLQPEGTYYYDIEANTYDGGSLTKRGDVALLH